MVISFPHKVGVDALRYNCLHSTEPLSFQHPFFPCYCRGRQRGAEKASSPLVFRPPLSPPLGSGRSLDLAFVDPCQAKNFPHNPPVAACTSLTRDPISTCSEPLSWISDPVQLTLLLLPFDHPSATTHTIPDLIYDISITTTIVNFGQRLLPTSWAQK